eukprot:UN25474
MDAVKYKYTDKEHKQLTWCHTSSRKRVFSATFGPRGSFQVFQACKNGEIKINTNTPLAKELLDVQDNGVEIFFEATNVLRQHQQQRAAGGGDGGCSFQIMMIQMRTASV